MSPDQCIEAEANLFALELLMPEKLVRLEVQRCGGIDLASDHQVVKIAKKFGVNVVMMAYRIGQLHGEIKC